VLKVFVNKSAVIDKLKIIDDKYLVAAGIDPKMRIWNIENEKLVSKFEVHKYCTIHLLFFKEFLYSYGYDKTLMKYNFMTKSKDCWIDVRSHI